MAWRVFVEQFKTTWAAPNLTPLVLTVMAAAFIGHIMPNRAFEKLTKAFVVMPIPLRAASLLVLALGIKEVSQFEVQPFIYFQF